MPGRALDRNEPAVVVQVVLHERPAGARDERDQLVRVDGAAPARGELSLVVGVEDRQGLVRRLGQARGDAGARLIREGERHLRPPGPRVCAARAYVKEDLFEPESGGHRREPGTRDGDEVLQSHVDLRPDVEEDVVRLERPSPPLRRTDALEAVREDPLDLGEPGERTGLVARGLEVAHLRQRHESLVAGAVRRDAAEQVGVLDRRESLQREPLQPPQPKAPRDHGVEAPNDALLDQLVVDAPEREVPVDPAGRI